MTEAVFLKVFNMALSAGYLVVAVLVLRLLLRRAPRWVHCVLWGLVGLRLILPVSLESVLSLIPSQEVVSPTIVTSPAPQIQTGLPVVDGSLNPVIGQTLAPAPADSVNPMQVAVSVAAWVWVAVALVLLAVAGISYWRLRRRVAEATPLRDNIFQCQNLPTTFILGFFKPRIYISYNINEEHLPLVLAHEQAHLKRRDHWIKPLAYLLLSVYWFHPLVWVGYILLCRDIELACDQRVMRALGADTRRAYAEALLYNGVHSRRIAACPLAFGEVGVKERVKSVMHYKKPAFWIVLVAVVACVVVAVCFLTSPKPTPTVTGCGTPDEDITIRVTELELEGDDPHITVRWENESEETVRLFGLATIEHEGDDRIESRGFLERPVEEHQLPPGETYAETISLQSYRFGTAGSYKMYIKYFANRTADFQHAWITFTVPEKLLERLNAAPPHELELFPQGEGRGFTQVTDEAFLVQYGYHVYYYDFDKVEIQLNGGRMDLAEALRLGTVTVEELLEYVQSVAGTGKHYSHFLRDSGTVIHQFPTYALIKQNSPDGERHCFIGPPGLEFEMLENFSPSGVRVMSYTLSVRHSEREELRRLTNDGYRAAHGFDVYTYGLDGVQVETSAGLRDLQVLLLDGTVTAEMLISDARAQWLNHQIVQDYTPDGPLYRLYKFGSYVLLHHVKENGGGNLYIGAPGMTFETLGQLTFHDPQITSYTLSVQHSGREELRRLTDDGYRAAHGFDVYTFGLDAVQVKTGEGMQDLSSLLQSNTLTAEMLINDARRQAARGEIAMDAYTDGGSQLFRFENYSLLKANRLDGDQNLYILAPGYDINDVQAALPSS